MRRIVLLSFAVLPIALAAIAGPALAQPGSTVPFEPTKPSATAPSNNPEADAALAMAMRQRAEQDARIAAIACQAGDTSKCVAPAPPSQEADSSAAAKTPKPS